MSVSPLKTLSKGRLCLKFNSSMKTCKGKQNRKNAYKADMRHKSEKALVKQLKLTLLVKKATENKKLNAKQNTCHNQCKQETRVTHNLKNVSHRHSPSYNSCTCRMIKISQISQNPRKHITNNCCYTWLRNSSSHSIP